MEVVSVYRLQGDRVSEVGTGAMSRVWGCFDKYTKMNADRKAQKDYDRANLDSGDPECSRTVSKLITSPR